MLKPFKILEGKFKPFEMDISDESDLLDIDDSVDEDEEEKDDSSDDKKCLAKKRLKMYYSMQFLVYILKYHKT